MDVLNTFGVLEQAALQEAEKKKKITTKPEYNFDKLQMYFGKDYHIKDYSGRDITIKMPKIGDVIKFGESRYYQAFTPFFINSTSIRLQLWNHKPRIDWNTIKDIQVFLWHSTLLNDQEIVQTVFPDLQFTDFQLTALANDPDQKPVLYSKSQQIIIPEDTFMEMTEYLRTVFNRHPVVQKAKGKSAKELFIYKDRMALANKQAQGDQEENSSSSLLSLVSACINHPGFKYTLDDLENMGIYQFMDSVKRINIYERATAVLKGMYSGFVDGTKIKPEQYDFMGDI